MTAKFYKDLSLFTHWHLFQWRIAQLHNSTILEKFAVESAEDMRSIESRSVDAVIGTHVLCSVKNQQRVFQEILRVLVPVWFLAVISTWHQFIKSSNKKFFREENFITWSMYWIENQLLSGLVNIYLANLGFGLWCMMDAYPITIQI